MKKIIILLVMIITSCQTSVYQTHHQARTLKKFNKPKHGIYIPERKRGDINHPAVCIKTRKLKK